MPKRAAVKPPEKRTRTSILAPATVGELRALIASLPDDMPLHTRGSVGEFPPTMRLAIINLAAALNDPTYFAAIEVDPIWSQPKHKGTFAAKFRALCVL
jgi:hypothetical protein